ncbi:MAG: hypothetical protein QOK04_1116, partial [Solirubrobacteraceae bacterium]|nr:hypothetical protein [Solirubrobacteraceae bacterium]
MSALRADSLLDAQLADIVQSSDDAIIGTTADGLIVTWNPGAERMYGYGAGEVVNKPMEILVPPEKSDELSSMLESVTRGERVDRYETVRERKDGSQIDISLTASAIRDAEGKLIGVSTIGRDVTARKAAGEALRDARARLKASFDRAPIGMALVSIRANSYGRFLHVNQALCELTGYSQEQLQTMTFQSLTHPDDIAKNVELMRQLLDDEIPSYQLEQRFIHVDREVSWVMLNASLVSDDSGAPLYCIHQLQDIAERKRFEVQLAHLADHDPLTGLFNRRRFGRELSREISYAERYGGGGAVLIIDIDNFKQINDTLGHN